MKVKLKRYSILNKFLIITLALLIVFLTIYLYVNIKNIIELSNCESVIATYNSNYLIYTTLTDHVYLVSCNIKNLNDGDLVKVFYYISLENKIITQNELIKDANPLLVIIFLVSFISIYFIKRKYVKEENKLLQSSNYKIVDIEDIECNADMFGKYIIIKAKDDNKEYKSEKIYHKQRKDVQLYHKVTIYYNLDEYLIYEYIK